MSVLKYSKTEVSSLSVIPLPDEWSAEDCSLTKTSRSTKRNPGGKF